MFNLLEVVRVMLKAIYAMNKTPGSAPKTEHTAQDIEAMIERSNNATSRARSKANCNEQLSTVVKMCLDGYTIAEIAEQTGVKQCFVISTKELFGLVRPRKSTQESEIRKILMESKPFTHNTSSIAKLTGYANKRVSRIIAKMSQVEKGTEPGLKWHYKYNFNIPVGAYLSLR